MSGPDRIYLQDAGDYESAADGEVTWCVEPQDENDTGYSRIDPAVLAALPEVQALIVGVLELAASMIEDNVRHAKDLGREIWPIPDIRALIPADAIAARDAMITAAIRKRREGQP